MSHPADPLAPTVTNELDFTIPETQKIAQFDKNGTQPPSVPNVQWLILSYPLARTGGPVVIKEGPVTQQKDLKPGEILVKVCVCIGWYGDKAHPPMHFVRSSIPEYATPVRAPEISAIGSLPLTIRPGL